MERLAVGGKDRGHGFSFSRNLTYDDLSFFMISCLFLSVARGGTAC